MSSPALVHEHDKVAIARHIHQRTPHSALGKALAQVAHHKAKGIPLAARALGKPGSHRSEGKKVISVPKNKKVPFDYAHSRGR